MEENLEKIVVHSIKVAQLNLMIQKKVLYGEGWISLSQLKSDSNKSD